MSTNDNDNDFDGAGHQSDPESVAMIAKPSARGAPSAET